MGVTEAVIIGAIIGAAGGAASSHQQKKSAEKSAKKDRQAQEKAAEEQRLLDAQAQRLAMQTDEDEEKAAFELGEDPLAVGRTKRGVRKVQEAKAAQGSAPTTGLRVG